MKTVNSILIFISVLIFFSCANQLSPGGGPLDTTPPMVIDSYPKSGTVNFDDDHISVAFSEYVDKRSVQEAIFISPAIEGQLEYSWSGKDLDIEFPYGLRDSITYVITIGTDVVDVNNRNHMAGSFTITFATGDKIDIGQVEGKVFAETPAGTMLFAYKNISDTLNPSKSKPDYITQAGTDGKFKLSGLAFGGYKIFAIKDEFRDLKYDIGSDAYGSPNQVVTLTDADTIFTGLDFFLTKDDTLEARIISAVMTDKYHVYVTMSEDIDTSIISAGKFYVVDSAANRTIAPLYAYKGKNNVDLFLVIKDTIPVESRAVLFAKNLIDLNKNITQIDSSELTVSDRPDTNKPGLTQTVPPNRDANAETDEPEFKFTFGDAFNVNAAAKGIVFTDTLKNKVNFTVNKVDDASFVVKPAVKLKPGTDYVIKLDMNYMKDIAGNYYDSVYTYNFTTISGLDFSGVSGAVKADKTLTNMYVILQSAATKDLSYKQRITGGTFNFNRVKPDKYILWGFDDADSSEAYSYGKPYPFKTSEKFSFYPDTLNLRARWPVGDVQFEIK
jgi:hypothetical protein